MEEIVVVEEATELIVGLASLVHVHKGHYMNEVRLLIRDRIVDPDSNRLGVESNRAYV